MRGNLIHFYVLSVIELKVYKSNNIKNGYYIIPITIN